MAVIITGGMIGLGKSSVAEILGKHFNSEVFYEKVDNNRVLDKFYTAPKEEIEKHRYPFLLQLEFLSSRYKSIKQALSSDNNVLDRSIYEDAYFLEINWKMGRISDLERDLYLELLDNMMEELQELNYKKSPDLMVYLKGSFETVMDRINKRNRGCEQDPELIEYFRLLWETYDEWIYTQYKASEILVIDMDEMDVVNNPDDAKKLCEMVEMKLKEIRNNNKKPNMCVKSCMFDELDFVHVICDGADKDVTIFVVENNNKSSVVLRKEDAFEMFNLVRNYFKN